jgi:hypothetical protein
VFKIVVVNTVVSIRRVPKQNPVSPKRTKAEEPVPYEGPTALSSSSSDCEDTPRPVMPLKPTRDPTMVPKDVMDYYLSDLEPTKKQIVLNKSPVVAYVLF